MTTVSKPNRNPARAEVTDQRRIRAFIAGGLLNAGEWPAGCGCNVIMATGKHHREIAVRTDSTLALETSYDNFQSCQVWLRTQNIATSPGNCAPTSPRAATWQAGAYPANPS